MKKRMDGPSSSKREDGNTKTTHGRGAGLLQPRNLAFHLLLRSCSARQSQPYYVRRIKLANRPHTERYGVRQHKPTHIRR